MKNLRAKREGYRRRASHDGTWAVSYGDMITLLLGFFVLFFSIEKPQTGNTLLSQSLLVTLENLDKNLVDRTMSGQQTEAKSDAEKESTASEESTIMETIVQIGKQFKNVIKLVLPLQSTGDKQFSAKTTPTAKEAGKPDQQLPFITREDDKIDIEALQARAIRQDDRIFITFPKISFFDSASTALTRDGEQAIRKFTEAYLPFAGTMELHIVGFSDQRAVRPGYHSFRDNLELSVLRAVNAQRVVARTGVPTARTRLLGHGVNTEPLPGEDPKNIRERLALARKIMLIIEPGKK